MVLNKDGKIKFYEKLGNPLYSAPEIDMIDESGLKLVYLRPPKCDIFSLGVIILELMGVEKHILKNLKKNENSTPESFIE